MSIGSPWAAIISCVIVASFLLERFGNAGKTGPQGGLCVLGRQGFRPIQGEVEGAAAVIDLMHLREGIWAFSKYLLTA